MDIAVVMITVDRSPDIPNYLAETLANLQRSSPEMELIIMDSGPEETSGKWMMQTTKPWWHWICELDCSKNQVVANLNIARALRRGSECGDWVLFVEDDIDVCDNFLASVEAWLTEFVTEDRRLYAFGSSYSQSRRGATDVPIRGFFGTQCIALRSGDAVDLAGYLEENCYERGDDGVGYDILMHDWSWDRWPHIEQFLASCPSFVQHIGRQSLIEPRSSTHTFPTWKGREWSWV